IFFFFLAMLGKSIGPKGANIEKLKTLFRKKVIVVADSDSLEGFVRSFFGNITIHSVEIRDVMGENNVMLTVEEKDRGIAIGREGDRIKAAKSFLKKKFNATIHIRTRRSEI
ncbi:KH domain-containing protein, partial [Candidatus Micrarchaeota archaeon]|nr:KH domain-containing protein [Candidatus Micrarchaeota archaeon]